MTDLYRKCNDSRNLPGADNSGENIVSSFSCCILMHFVLHRVLK
nr:MAG TPA: hypothetical protein [Caudoviricetes sp.]